MITQDYAMYLDHEISTRNLLYDTYLAKAKNEIKEAQAAECEVDKEEYES